MKLLTHNMLSCHIKVTTMNAPNSNVQHGAQGVTQGYPFQIEATKVEVRETDYDPDFLRHMFGRIEWHALVAGAKAMGVEGLPEQVRARFVVQRAVHTCTTRPRRPTCRTTTFCKSFTTRCWRCTWRRGRWCAPRLGGGLW